MELNGISETTFNMQNLNLSYQHGGHIYRFAQEAGCHWDEIIDFSSNINPHQAVQLNTIAPGLIAPYAEPDYHQLKQQLKRRYPAFQHTSIEPFNGASAAIFALFRFLQPTQCTFYAPLYAEYKRIAALLNCQQQLINRLETLTTPVKPYSTIVFVNPTTPDGTCYDLTPLLETWITANCTIIIDESFLDFTNAMSIATKIIDYEKLFVIKSLTKFYGCAGVRIGLIAGSEKMITALRQQEPAWKLSSWDMNYIGQALNNNQFITDTLTQTQQNRHDLKEILLASKLFSQIFESDANFILAKLANLDGYQLQQKLKPYRILIRICDNFDFLDASYVRLAVKKAEDILRLKTALESIQ